jgi:hypothetical protein
VNAVSGHLREEPYAGKPHVRICEGESQMAELLDHPQAALVPELIAEDKTPMSITASFTRLRDTCS